MSNLIIKDIKIIGQNVTLNKIYNSEKIFETTILELPKISDKQLIEIYTRIKPLIKNDKNFYNLREFNLFELRFISFLWNQLEDKRDIVDMSNCEVVNEFECYHSHAFRGFFKPTIAEVACQMPEETKKYANAFRIVDFPKTEKDLYKDKNIIGTGYHKSLVKSYIIKK